MKRHFPSQSIVLSIHLLLGCSDLNWNLSASFLYRIAITEIRGGRHNGDGWMEALYLCLSIACVSTSARVCMCVRRRWGEDCTQTAPHNTLIQLQRFATLLGRPVWLAGASPWSMNLLLQPAPVELHFTSEGRKDRMSPHPLWPLVYCQTGGWKEKEIIWTENCSRL